DFGLRATSERPEGLRGIVGGLLVETRYLGALHGGTVRRRRLSRHKGIARRLTWRGGSRSSGRMTSRSRPASRSLRRSDPSPRWEADPRPSRSVRVGLPAVAARTADIHRDSGTPGTSADGTSSPALPER